jgi:hypothetical protein
MRGADDRGELLARLGVLGAEGLDLVLQRVLGVDVAVGDIEVLRGLVRDRLAALAEVATSASAVTSSCESDSSADWFWPALTKATAATMSRPAASAPKATPSRTASRRVRKVCIRLGPRKRWRAVPGVGA